MSQNEILSSSQHGDVRIRTGFGAQFGDAQMQTLVLPFEFRNIQAHYPIFFQADANDDLFPVALLGFEEGENLFLEGDRWDAAYVPAIRRRDPFLVGVKDAHLDDGRSQQMRVLSIDMSHPRVSREEGEPLFDALGGRTEFLEEQAGLLETLHEHFEHCRAFARALNEAGLIEPVTMNVTLRDGSTNQLIGLRGLDEEKVQTLSAERLDEFNQKGYLLPLFMIMASMSNMRALIERKNAAVEGSP